MDGNGSVLNRRLSGVDAGFLYLERKEIPLHIAAVLVFEAAIPFDEFVRNIESKLYLIPRYRQIVVFPPMNIGYPEWGPAPNFDIHQHIFETHLEGPGGQAELEKLAGNILTPVMDRTKPLWDIHVVDGLRDGRGALIIRVHHALADGISAAGLLQVLLDTTPEGSPVPAEPPVPPKAEEQPEQPLPEHSLPEHSLIDALASATRSCLENLIAAEEIMLDFAQALTSDRMKSGLQGVLSLLPELARPAQRLPFNKPCDGDRLFCWTQFDFAEVKEIKSAAGCTVNDVVLTVLTRALAKYVRFHGESLTDRYFHVVCPVNLRSDQGQSLGNQITFLPLVLPLGETDPMRLLHSVAQRTEIMKSARAAELVSIATCWLGAAPTPLQMGFWRTIPQIPLPVPLLNMICTNVPGSRVPLYTLGRKLLASYPQVPTGYELGINCAVQTYDGQMSFGLIADSHAAPDVTRLRDLIRKSFVELCRAAGVRKARPMRRPKPGPKAGSAPKVRTRSKQPAEAAPAGA